MSEQYTPQTDITSDDKLWSLLAYIFTPLIPIIILLIEDKKNRPFIKAHNAQALAFGIVAFVINFALSFVFVGFCTAVITLGLCIYWGIKAYQGEYVNIPVITNFVKNQGWA